jgi:hypothetical protein
VYEFAFNADPLRKALQRIPLLREPGSIVLQENIAENVLHESLVAVLNPPAEGAK